MIDFKWKSSNLVSLPCSAVSRC